MEIKVTSTGVTSRMPGRFVANIAVKSYGNTVEEARDLQATRLKSIRDLMGSYNVNFSYLSVANAQPNVVGVEVKGEDGRTTRKFESQGYFVTTFGEFVLSCEDMITVSVLSEGMMDIPGCSVNYRFELTDEQKNECQVEALKRSYDQAVFAAMNIYELENGEIDSHVSICIKECSLRVVDYGGESSGVEFGSARMAKMADTAVMPVSVRKPLKFSVTVDYIFEDRGD